MKLPKRFYRGNPRRLVAPEKSIRPCDECGTHGIFDPKVGTPLCPKPCVGVRANHDALMLTIEVDRRARIGA